MALTNVVGSSIARTAGDCVMYTYAGPEIAVASTKAYITQVEMMVLLAIDLGVKRGHLTESAASELLRQMADIPALAEQVMALEPAVRASPACTTTGSMYSTSGAGWTTRWQWKRR